MIVNRDHTVRGPYTAFAEVAGAYERGRPGYPDEAVQWLVGLDPRDVVDLGAGTGKLTRALVGLGHRVTAVEPLDEMRAELEAALPDVHAVAGRAESMPLPDSSADVVTSAQAFHWFDHDDALPEIGRVLRPRGRIALVWNSRDDRDPWMARLSEIIGNESIEESDVVPILDASGLFGPVETAQFSFQQVARSRRAARPRPLAQLPREASAAGSAAGSRRCRQPLRRDCGARRRETRVRHGVLPRRAALVELAADSLDVVAVGVQEERRVVATAVLGAVLLADSRGAVVSGSCVDAGAVEGVDLLA